MRVLLCYQLIEGFAIGLLGLGQGYSAERDYEERG
jgi:hypothetical protein